jgi:hypothetical protein
MLLKEVLLANINSCDIGSYAVIWVDLYLSGLYSFKPSTDCSYLNQNTPSSVWFGATKANFVDVIVPKFPLKYSAYYALITIKDPATGSGKENSIYNMKKGSYIFISNDTSSTMKTIMMEDAFVLDKKLDDGIFNSGNFRTRTDNDGNGQGYESAIKHNKGKYTRYLTVKMTDFW